MSADGDDTAPVLVLALGNLLLRDDGVGLRLLDELRDRLPASDDVELLDGGTQGLALLGRITGRHALLVLDAIALGHPPGTVHCLHDPLTAAPPRASSAHEANAGELLRAAALLDALSPHVVVIGVEPAVTGTGIGLSKDVESAIPAALRVVDEVLSSVRVAAAREVASCTS